MQGAEGPRWRDNFEGGAGILGQARYGTGLVLVFGWVRKGDWGLGIGDGRARPGVQSTRRMDSGQRHQACRTGDGWPWTWGRWRTGRRASNGESGSGVFNAMCGRRTRKCDNQENKHPEIPRFSGKQSATTTTTETRLRHSMCYFRAGALGMVSPRFSPLKKREGVSPLQLLLLEVPLLFLLHRDRTHPPPSPFSTTPMLASATSERGDCHLGVVDKESPGTEVTGDGRTTLKKDPLTHRVTTKLTDMTFLPPGKPPRADNESRMRIAAKARADGCAKNDGCYFGPGTEHTLLLFLVKLGFSGAPRNKWSGLFSPLFLHMFIQPGNNFTWGLRWLAGLAPSSRHHRPAT